MPEVSQIRTISEEIRKKSLEKNIYRINSPYDITSDIVTRSLNFLRNVTGYDYRSNPVIDILERGVDAKDSRLVQEGAVRLGVEFGRRAALNYLDKFIPSPTSLLKDSKDLIKGNFTKEDTRITVNPDINKNSFDSILQKSIGYIPNENIIGDKFIKYNNKGYDLKESNNILNKYTGKINKNERDKLLNLNKFSTLNTKENLDIIFSGTNLVFQKYYSENYFNDKINKGLSDNNLFDRYYFNNYEIIPGNITKDYRQELKNIENDGFGSLQKENNDRTQSTSLKSNSDIPLNDLDSFTYSSDKNTQKNINTKFGVKRGLVYLTSKLVEENESLGQDNKELYRNIDSSKKEIIYYKGNGECRTFTINDQYDNYKKLIRFSGNKQEGSVIKDSVLPKIAPLMKDTNEDKHKYFFTIENLALKNAYSLTDCETGPNGGSFMWFVPYDVRISDNNSASWTDLYFLGRPEPLFSYQNTVRNLSISFRLLIDTVKDFEKKEKTIGNYRSFLYNLGNQCENNISNDIQPQPQPTQQTSNNQVTKIEETINLNTVTYYFKNASSTINVDNPDYTKLDTGIDFDENGKQITLSDLSGYSYNNSFTEELTKFLDTIITTKESNSKAKININIEAAATTLGKQNNLAEQNANINLVLSFQRGVELTNTIINQLNLNNFNLDLLTESNIPNTNQTLVHRKRTEKLEFTFNITPKGQRGKFTTYDERNSNKDVVLTRSAIATGNILIEDAVISDNSTNIPPEQSQSSSSTQSPSLPNKPCDDLDLTFNKIDIENKFPIGFEKLNVFAPTFHSQTPYDFTKRYVFLHQTLRPGKLLNTNESADNIIFGRMPVIIIKYADFIHSKAIVRSVNFDISDSTWDLNPEGMGVIPMYCNVTMDLTLFGGQSLKGPIDRVQTANDKNYIANSTFKSKLYENNKYFKSARDVENEQY